MSSTIPTSIYGRALAEAQAELNTIRAEYEKLAKRKDQLEAFIANTEPLLPVSVKPATLPLEPPTSIFHIPVGNKPSQPIWKSILLSINGKHQSFTVKDALSALDRIDRPINSPNKVQIMRSTLMNKKEYFEKIGPGLFRVRKGLEMEGASEEAP